MGKKNSTFRHGQPKANYSARQKIVVDAYRKAERDTVQQLMTDMFMLVLNDPEVMGKDTFGKVRMKRVIDAINRKLIEWDNLLAEGDEQDYYQIKLDRLLEPLCTDFKPFAERYPWLKPPK